MITEPEQIKLLRLAVIGLLGQVEEYAENIGPCEHGVGICRCRQRARIKEALEALEKTKKHHEPKQIGIEPVG